MRLIKFLSLSLFCIVPFVLADNSKLLSNLKQDIIKTNKQQNELNSDNLENSWINSISGTLSHSNSDTFTNNRQDTNTLSISMNQPIFKSGGIYCAIKYANANRKFLRIVTKNNEQTQIKTILSALYNIKKLNLQIQKQQYLIENAEIDIMRKKEQYENDFLDSSYLNQAILSKSSLDRALMDMQSSKFEMLKTLKAYSDLEYENIKLPKFSLINESEFLNKSLIIEQKNSEIVKNEYLKKMTISSYLPTISLNAGYYNVHDFGTKNYTTYGLNFTMPIVDFNRGRNIEIQRLEYLKSKLAFEDIKRSEKQNYDLTINKINILEKKIALAKEDLKLYDSLLKSTNDLFKAGEKTKYDVDTLSNSKKTMSIDAKIFKTDIQLSLLDLYAKMNGEI